MRHLAVFARAPVAGRVKSRLSPALPAELAARLYAGLLADTFDAGLAARARARTVFWSDEPGAAPAAFACRPQSPGDLGERLRAAFDELLGPPGTRALLIGSDTPALTAAHLDEAFAALESHDVVIGPTLDGGYWGIGLAARAPDLFRDIPWSTREVLTRTLVRAHAAQLRVATAATLDDLDTPQDLAALAGRLAAGEPACGPRAWTALVRMGLAVPGRARAGSAGRDKPAA